MCTFYIYILAYPGKKFEANLCSFYKNRSVANMTTRLHENRLSCIHKNMQQMRI